MRERYFGDLRVAKVWGRGLKGCRDLIRVRAENVPSETLFAFRPYICVSFLLKGGEGLW